MLNALDGLRELLKYVDSLPVLPGMKPPEAKDILERSIAEVLCLREMVVAAREACYSEYMSCPWCCGHIGVGNDLHDQFCKWPRMAAEIGVQVTEHPIPAVEVN